MRSLARRSHSDFPDGWHGAAARWLSGTGSSYSGYIAASGEPFEAGGYELRVIDITEDPD